MNLRWFTKILSCAIPGVGLGIFLLGEWGISARAPDWVRTVGMEIQAAGRDAGTQWMVVACLVSYFGTFLFLERRLFQPQKNPKNAKGETAPPTSGFWLPSSIAAFLAFFRGNISNPNFWLVGLVGIVLLRYAFAYETAARSLQPLVLLAGIVFGKGIALWGAWQPSLQAENSGLKLGKGSNAEYPTINSQPSSINKARAILYILVFLLACASQWQPEYGMDFQYRGQRRWTSAWDNPNLYGLLMGGGAILAVGLFVQSLKSKSQSPRNAERGVRSAEWWRWVKTILFLTAAGMCGFGWVKSYSRGAWVGTACGLGWLLWKWISRTHLTPALSPRPTGGEGEALSCHSCVSWLKTNWLPLAVLLASVLVLSFWQFRHTENPLARRVFSIGNPNDFSWRNRVSTWAGAVTMMEDRPWVGHGWGKSEAVFGEKYKPVRLEDAAAIQMNDYLMLGISCGVPALLCLFAYLWLVLMRSAEWGVRSGEKCDSVGLQPSDLSLQPSVVAGAGATVLLVGFWFDGGLFKLPTAAVFWVLIELASGRSRSDETQTSPVLAGPVRDSSRRLLPLTTWQICLRWLAGMLAALAIAQTVLHLGTPRLAISERNLSIARQFLVPPKAKTDFEFLAAEPIWPAKKLGTLLEHVELANYNRELVNWKLADDVYRRFVLSPQIDSALDGDMNWRRPLWESFYPRIRKESSLEAVAEIIVRHLRERVRIVETPGSPETIAEIWQRGVASERGLEVIYVAALRSAGVPARLSPFRKTEFWNGVEWKLAPRPVDVSTGSK